MDMQLVPASAGDRTFHVPQSEHDWLPYKDRIAELYDSHKLQKVMDIMLRETKFQATINQYKKQISKWGLDNKRIKGKGYQGILKVKRRRERDFPSKSSKFTLHGIDVDSEKIKRYEKRVRDKGEVGASDTLSDLVTPPGLQWSTPSREVSPLGSSQVHASSPGLCGYCALGVRPLERSAVSFLEADRLRRSAWWEHRQTFYQSQLSPRLTRSPSISDSPWWSMYVQWTTPSPPPSRDESEIMRIIRRFAKKPNTFQAQSVIGNLIFKHTAYPCDTRYLCDTVLAILYHDLQDRPLSSVDNTELVAYLFHYLLSSSTITPQFAIKYVACVCNALVSIGHYEYAEKFMAAAFPYLEENRAPLDVDERRLFIANFAYCLLSLGRRKEAIDVIPFALDEEHFDEMKAVVIRLARDDSSVCMRSYPQARGLLLAEQGSQVEHDEVNEERPWYSREGAWDALRRAAKVVRELQTGFAEEEEVND